MYPDQAVILRGDGHVEYNHIVDVMDTCREANIWNVAFATVRPPTAPAMSRLRRRPEVRPAAS